MSLTTPPLTLSVFPVSPLEYPQSVENLILKLKSLPGIGPRSAERMAIWLLSEGQSVASELGLALVESQERNGFCQQCGFFSETPLCPACSNEARDHQKICIVEHAADIIPIERCGVYSGVYHCLGGKLSPLNDIEPEDLRISELIERVKVTKNAEIILALGSDVEGEATSYYLTDILRPFSCTITRLAQGLPAGSGLSYADTLTLSRAFSDRREIS